MTEFSRGAIEAKAVELHAEQCPNWDCPYGVTASWRHYAEEVLQAETEAKAETTTATDEADQYLVERHLAHVASAVEDYRKVYPEPHALSPNLDLAVTGARLLAAGRAETTTATDEDAAQVIQSAFNDWWKDYGDTRDMGAVVTQALADAGLLATDRPETTAEWGVSWPKDGDGYVARVSQEKSARFVANRDGGVVVRREVTAWTEVG